MTGQNGGIKFLCKVCFPSCLKINRDILGMEDCFVFCSFQSVYITSFNELTRVRVCKRWLYMYAYIIEDEYVSITRVDVSLRVFPASLTEELSPEAKSNSGDFVSSIRDKQTNGK